MNIHRNGRNDRQSKWAPPEQGSAYQRGPQGPGQQGHTSLRSKPQMPPTHGNNWWDRHTKSGGNFAPASEMAHFDLSCNTACAQDLFFPLPINMDDTGKPRSRQFLLCVHYKHSKLRT